MYVQVLGTRRLDRGREYDATAANQAYDAWHENYVELRHSAGRLVIYRPPTGKLLSTQH